MTNLVIPANDGGSFNAYVAMPQELPAPCVLVAQEIFGVNEGMRAKCDWLAGQGFIAVCPDLFWRLEPGIELTDRTEAEWKQAFDLYNRFDVDQGIEDMRATRHTFMGHADSTGKVGCIGYCLGGNIAYLMAARSDIDASVSYYGVGIDQLLEEAENIKNPLMLHIAEEDEFVDKGAQEKIKEGLSAYGHISIRSYPGVNHAFSRTNGQNFDAQAASLADSRTIAFLQENLR